MRLPLRQSTELYSNHRSRWRDFWIYTRSNHPLLSVFLVDNLHPFSKIERFFHGIVTVLYRHILHPHIDPFDNEVLILFRAFCSVVMGHIALAVSINRTNYCTNDVGML